MTTIAALHVPGWGSVIAADRQITNNGCVGSVAPTTSKLVREGDWVIGVCGSLRALNVLRNHRDILFDRLDDVEEMPDRLQEILKNSGFHAGSNEDGGPVTFGQSFVMASSKGVWVMDVSLSIHSPQPNEIAAIGSGGDYAIGSSHITESWRDPVKRVRAAIDTACRFDAFSGFGVDVIDLRIARKK